MDDVWNRNRNVQYFQVMARIEAQSLMNRATTLSLHHIRDALVRVRFQDEMKKFISIQLGLISSGASDGDCRNCLNNIRQESEYLSLQDRMLRTGQAKLVASVSFYQKHEKLIGYLIDGVLLIIGGVQVVAGAGIMLASLPTLNVIGMVAGATMVLNGTASVLERGQKLAGNKTPGNFMLSAWENGAEFLGFDRRVGYLGYQTSELATSVYGIMKFVVKPDAWRLFRYMPNDYYHKIQGMGAAGLAIQGGAGAYKGVNIGATLYDLNRNDSGLK